jgi:hypothetical protein
MIESEMDETCYALDGEPFPLTANRFLPGSRILRDGVAGVVGLVASPDADAADEGGGAVALEVRRKELFFSVSAGVRGTVEWST